MTSETASSSDREYLTVVRRHLERIIQEGRAGGYGPEETEMWMSSLDTRTGRYPEDDRRPEGVGKRVYRNIDAPRGSSLYWDQPQIVAAHTFSRVSGDARFSNAADAYVRDFLARCVASTGLLLWGNHYYYDVFRGKTMAFKGTEDPQPVGPSDVDGRLHEVRPIPPAWGAFWRLDPDAARSTLLALTRHFFDPDGGGFNRHADGKAAHAFLEAGGVLCESFAWLYGRTGDERVLRAALRVARYSFENRNSDTGLIENNPTSRRWDKNVCSTEVGLWAGSLMRAAERTGRSELMDWATEGVTAYLRHGYDERAGRYHGMLRVADGTPAEPEPGYDYMPGVHAELWTPLFPRHDYPLAMAESCARLYAKTQAPVFAEAVRRWAQIIRDDLPARGGRGAYAEHYGRAIHFLLSAEEAIPGEGFRLQALKVADEAVEVLFANGMFRGHPGEERYDAVDGVGFLLLALIRLATGRPAEDMGFGF
jgi:hypothetical protein